MDDAIFIRERKPWEERLFLITILIYLLGSPILLLPFSMVELLWFYTSVVAGCWIFPLAFFLAKREGKRLWACLLSGFRWTVIGCGAWGLLLTSTVLLMPGYKPFTLGYWIHAKLWLNPNQLRTWALTQTNVNADSREIPYKDWPPSLKNVAYGAEMLLVDPDTKTVTLIEGGGFGHWGITVAQLPQTNELSSGYSIKLDKGSWVWHEIQ